MRATLLLLLAFGLSGLFFWVRFSGVWFVILAVIWLIFSIISVGYRDAWILFLLGAREVRASDEKGFFEAASQEAYKLAVQMPRLYFYNSPLERVFILQAGSRTSIVANKGFLETCSSSDLVAISFQLLLQVKKRMAAKRTKAMFVVGLISWLFNSIFNLILLPVSHTDFERSVKWALNFILHPFLGSLFKFMIGEGYYKKLYRYLEMFPNEKYLVDNLGLKLRKPENYFSLPSRKVLEFANLYKSRHFQNILSLEFLPHEWDYLFKNEGTKRDS